MSSPIVIVIDGLIASGKTTMITQCLLPILTQRGYRVTVIPEPVEKWKENGRLKMFYSDPSRRAFQFQTCAFHDRVRISQKLYRKYAHQTDVFILERSIFSDLLFMEALRDSKTIDTSEFEDYMNLWTMWEEVMPFRPDLFVYLRPNIDCVMDRLKERSRDGESSITIQYQKDLEKRHDILYGGDFVVIGENYYVPSIILETNDNFRDDNNVKEQLTSIIEKEFTRIAFNRKNIHT